MMKIKRSILQFKELYFIPFEKKLSDFDSHLHNENKALFEEIRVTHKEYITTISSPEMAMSLELANFLFAYCLKNKPAVLLDLGSGFSSYIFRLYKKYSKTPVIVSSVDDHDEWLKKTMDYLSEQNVSTDLLFNLDTFKENAQANSYDLILLDLNFVEKRKDFIEFSINLLKPTGMLIVDDVHKVEFLREVKEKAKKNNCKLFNIKNQTKDSFGRFSILLSKLK
ncbi:MAG: response regulator [Bacteroidetes bacterium]|nr:response regulator [Bacteroidota bacterium]